MGKKLIVNSPTSARNADLSNDDLLLRIKAIKNKAAIMSGEIMPEGL